MNKSRFNAIFIFFFLSNFLFIFVVTASAGVVVYDDVSSVNKTLKLKAITKGKFFTEGGKLVKFYMNGKHIGTTLSGGDGFAFMKYLSSSPGTKSLKVETGDGADEGMLLITDSNDKVILIAIEATLFEPIFQLKPTKEGKDVLKQLSDKFRIIYLSTLMGITNSRKWLKNNGFPLSPVLKWEGTEMLAELQERGIPLFAIVASADIISEIPDMKKKFTFEETEEGIVLKDWKDLLKKLE